MSLKYTLLGFLSYGPQTGYDLKKHKAKKPGFSCSIVLPRMSEVPANARVSAQRRLKTWFLTALSQLVQSPVFWHATLSQIYPTLKKLAEEGLVEATVISQEGRPDKKIYFVTEAGRATLMDWLVEPMDELPLTKDPALLKLFFSGALDKETLLSQLRHQLALRRAQLAHYQQETAVYVEQVIAETGLTREGVMWELARQFGEEYERAYIRWLEQAIATVEQNFGLWTKLKKPVFLQLCR